MLGCQAPDMLVNSIWLVVKWVTCYCEFHVYVNEVDAVRNRLCFVFDVCISY